MSSSTDPLITTIPTQVTIYLGIGTLVGGVLGGILNIAVFLSLKTFRQSSCAFFLTVMSFVNIGQLMTSLFSRILITGFGKDWTETSVAFCKFRNYCLQICTLISYTCMCLATIDQFLATSLHTRWQKCLTLRRAQYICAFFICLWLLCCIPSLIWFAPIFSVRSGTVSCTATDALFTKILRYTYTLTFAGIVPIVTTVLFATLAYRNVRQIPYRSVPLVRRELDKQLTSIVLVQVAHNFLVVFPYITILLIAFHTNPTPDSPNQTAIRFTTFITGMFYYFYFAVSLLLAKDVFLKRVFVSPFLEPLLHLCLRIEKISTTTHVCSH